MRTTREQRTYWAEWPKRRREFAEDGATPEEWRNAWNGECNKLAAELPDLLADIEELEGEVERLRGALEAIKEYPEEQLAFLKEHGRLDLVKEEFGPYHSEEYLDPEAFETEGDYASDARYHYPDCRRLVCLVVKAALQGHP